MKTFLAALFFAAIATCPALACEEGQFDWGNGKCYNSLSEVPGRTKGETTEADLHPVGLRPNERQFVEFEMTVISIANNCTGYQTIEGSLPKWAASTKVRPGVVEAVHAVLQVAAGAPIPSKNMKLIAAVGPIVFDTLANMRDTLKKAGACDLLGENAVNSGFLRRDKPS